MFTSWQDIGFFSDLKWSQLTLEFAAVFLIQLLSIGLTLGVLMLLATIFDAASRSMSWFSNTWLIFGLFYCPIMFCLGIGPASYVSIKNKVRTTFTPRRNPNFFTNKTKTIYLLASNPFELLHSNVPSFTMHYLHRVTVGNDWNGIKIGVRFIVCCNFLHSNDIC